MQIYCPRKEQLIEQMVVTYLNKIAHHVGTMDLDNADAIMQEFLVDGIEPYDQEFMFVEDLTQLQ